MSALKKQSLLHLLRLFVSFNIILVDSKQPPCYMLKLLAMRTTETPYYRFEMTLHSNQTLSSVTRVLKEIPVTVWHIQIVQHTKPASNAANARSSTHGNGAKRLLNPLQPAQGIKTLYNATYKTCEFWKYVRRISVFSNVADAVLSKERTNLSLSCPLPVGTYVMRNIHVPPDTGLLKYMFVPNTIYTLYGTIYSQRSDKSLVKKCSYEINGTVSKTC